jgi:hypothetical protein
VQTRLEKRDDWGLLGLAELVSRYTTLSARIGPYEAVERLRVALRSIGSEP